jgi:hypothetical protein
VSRVDERVAERWVRIRRVVGYPFEQREAVVGDAVIISFVEVAIGDTAKVGAGLASKALLLSRGLDAE